MSASWGNNDGMIHEIVMLWSSELSEIWTNLEVVEWNGFIAVLKLDKVKFEFWLCFY